MARTKHHTDLTHLAIRPAVPADAGVLADLAALDSAAPLTGDALIAEQDGRAVAAIALADRRVVADPFVPTLAVAEVLRARARHLHGSPSRFRRGGAVRRRALGLAA